MKRSSDFYEDELKNPLYVVMGGAVFLLIVVLFCVIVWNVTHSGDDNIVNSNNLTQSEGTMESEPISETIIVQTTPAPTATPDPETAALEQLIAEQSNDQGVVFTEINDVVTARGVTNLRSEPSTAQQNATVVDQLENGVNAMRIGYNEEVGWSKLVYNGKIVYASTAYLVVVEEADE